MIPTSVRKRDGQIVAFEPGRIRRAISKAAIAAGADPDEVAGSVIEKVLSSLSALGDPCPEVELIQDCVERDLMNYGYPDVAKSYILYREQHARIRSVTSLMDDGEALISKYLASDDWKIKENSNMTFSLQGLNNRISAALTEQYWLHSIYTPEIRDAHVSGHLHIHDLGQLSTYCVGWDLRDLLVRGFGGVSGKIESGPAKHFRSALGQIVNFFYTLQGESAGAQAFSNFDTYLAPFIRHDDLSYEEVKQNMQAFIFNMNVPTRVGFQTPFTNLTMDLVVPEILRNDHIIIGGVPQDTTYGDYQAEMNMINRAFAEIMTEGDSKGRLFTFPIPTYNITRDFNWDDDNLRPLWEMTAKYGIPYFANYVNSDMNPDDARSMCPIGANERILFKSQRYLSLECSTIGSLYNRQHDDRILEIFANGKFVKGSISKYDNLEFIRVRLKNGHTLDMAKSHLNLCKKSQGHDIEELSGSDLKEGYYLPYSTIALEGHGGSYDLGYLVGAFAGDGTVEEAGVVYSLNTTSKLHVAEKIIKIANREFGATFSVTPEASNLKLYVASKAMSGLMKDYVEGIKTEKHYKARLYQTDIEFRKGVLQGHIDTDGGSRHRIYTASEKMVSSLNLLAATLGTTTSVKSDTRDGRYSDNPVYSVLVYRRDFKSSLPGFYFTEDGYFWVPIEKIEPLSASTGYCFEIIDNDDPVFTVAGSGILTHNCRLRLDSRELRKRGGGLFGAHPLTGSIGVVTLNLPRIAYEASQSDQSLQCFFDLIDQYMLIARDSLEIKRRAIERFTEKGLYPYCRHYLSAINERFGHYWTNHFSTIGLVGMNEACLNLMGRSIAAPLCVNFACDVLDHMRDRILEFQQETGNFYNLEATPAEGVSYRLARIDREKCPGIIASGSGNPYYTNSIHPPVSHFDDIFDLLDHQDELQTRFTGGTVVHLHIGERINDPLMVRKLVRTVSQNYRLPYFTISPVFSICPVHGYIAGNKPVCPYEHTEEDLDRYGVIPSHKESSNVGEESYSM